MFALTTDNPAVPAESATPAAPTVRVWRPSRVYRREVNGQPCLLCRLRMHHMDVAGISPLDETGTPIKAQTVFVHEACARLLTAPATQPEEDTGGQGREHNPKDNT